MQYFDYGPLADKPLLVIVTGPPGAGKTTIGRRLAADLRFPFICKDDIKDTLFDTLGWQDREWSRRLGYASMMVMFEMLERELEADRSAVAETAFIPEFHTPRFLDLRDRYGCALLQVFCTAPVEILFERFQRRALSGERHPGHLDHLTTLAAFEQAQQERRWMMLDLDAPLIRVDTTVLDRVDGGALLAQVHAIARGSIE